MRDKKEGRKQGMGKDRNRLFGEGLGFCVMEKK